MRFEAAWKVDTSYLPPIKATERTDKTEKQRQQVNLIAKPVNQPLLTLTWEAKLQPGDESQLALSQGACCVPQKTV